MYISGCGWLVIGIWCWGDGATPVGLPATATAGYCPGINKQILSETGLVVWVKLTVCNCTNNKRLREPKQLTVVDVEYILSKWNFALLTKKYESLITCNKLHVCINALSGDAVIKSKLGPAPHQHISNRRTRGSLYLGFNDIQQTGHQAFLFRLGRAE